MQTMLNFMEIMEDQPQITVNQLIMCLIKHHHHHI